MYLARPSNWLVVWNTRLTSVRVHLAAMVCIAVMAFSQPLSTSLTLASLGSGAGKGGGVGVWAWVKATLRASAANANRNVRMATSPPLDRTARRLEPRCHSL